VFIAVVTLAIARAAFIRTEVAPKAKAVRASHRWWRRRRARPPQ
jgi:hypothetical protein